MPGARLLLHKFRQNYITKALMAALDGYSRAHLGFFLLPSLMFQVSKTTWGKAKQNITY